MLEADKGDHVENQLDQEMDPAAAISDRFDQLIKDTLGQNPKLVQVNEIDDEGRNVTKIIDKNTGEEVAQKIFNPLPDSKTDFETEVIKLNGSHVISAKNNKDNQVKIPVTVASHKYQDHSDRTLIQVTLDKYNLSFLPADKTSITIENKPVIAQAFGVVGLNQNKIKL